MSISAPPVSADISDEHRHDGAISFVFTKDTKFVSSRVMSFQFIPPCFVRLEMGLGAMGVMVQQHACLPVERGKTRLVYRMYRSFFKWFNSIPGSGLYFERFSNKIVDQDVEMLLAQMDNLNAGADPWNVAVKADALGKWYRTWRKTAEAAHNPWFVSWPTLQKVTKNLSVQTLSDAEPKKAKQKEKQASAAASSSASATASMGEGTSEAAAATAIESASCQDTCVYSDRNTDQDIEDLVQK